MITLVRQLFALLRLLFFRGYCRLSPKALLVRFLNAVERCWKDKEKLKQIFLGQESPCRRELRVQPGLKLATRTGTSDVSPTFIYASKEPACYPTIGSEQIIAAVVEVQRQRRPNRVTPIEHHPAPTSNSLFHKDAIEIQITSQAVPPRPYECAPSDRDASSLGTYNGGGLTPVQKPLCPPTRASIRTTTSHFPSVIPASYLPSLPMAPLEQLSQTTSSTASIMSVDSAKDASSVSDTLFSDHATVFALVDTSESLIRPRRRQRMFPALKTHRYDRGTKLEESSFEYTVRPVQTKYSLEGVPDGWEAVTHPEGCLYFYNRARKIYTEAWLCDPETLDEIEDFAALLEEVARDDKKDIPPDSELVLELEVNPTKETKHYWAYYYVDHAERVLFWLHEYVVSQELEALRGMQSASQIKYGIETYYWGHWEFFPIGQTVTEELRNEVLRNLIHDGVDQLTSASSTAGLTPDVTEKLISMIKTSRDLGSNQHTARTLGRLMSLFAHSKYHNYYGQQAARLDCNTSLFNNERNRSLWIISFAALLFKYPLVHLHAIEKVWIDGVIHEITWTRFVTDLRKEWREAIIASAVLLLANLSFLRIAVDTEASQHRTPAQTTSLVSMIACVSSVVLGMQLIRQYRVKPRKTALDAVTYLQSQEHPRLGMETLAIVYSLPYALCMWAIVTFMTALALECFYVQDEATIITTAVAWCLVAICATLCSLSFWQGGDSNSLFLRDWAHRLWNKAHNASRSLGGSSQREDTALTPNSSSGSTTELFEV